VEDEDVNMLVIRSKTIVLEENLHKAEAHTARLQQVQLNSLTPPPPPAGTAELPNLTPPASSRYN